MAGQFENKVVAVTGASSGIGRALALDLGSKGAVLALADKDAAEQAEAKALLGNRPASIATKDARFIDLMIRLFPVSYFKRIGAFIGGGDR